MRTILYSGKGGVGKTTVSAATALKSAQLGYKTLVISTDPAHSLADSLDQHVGDRPTPISDNLWAMEINVLTDIKFHWDELQAYMTGLLMTRGFDKVVAEELAVAPGMEEVCSLLHLNQQHQEGFFDCLILDMAPTGESLRLLSMPDVIDWYMGNIYPWVRKMAGLARAIAPVPFIPSDSVFAAVERFMGQLNGVRDVLANAKETSVRLVVNPEKMVLKEARRAFTYLNLYGYNVDAVISNRIWPAAFLEQRGEWGDIQARYQAEIEHSFAPLPIFKVPLMNREVVGLDMLRQVADQLFGSQDPTALFHSEVLQKIEPVAGGYELKLRLPFVEKEFFQLNKKGDDLIIDLKNFRKEVTLPRTIAHLEPSGGRFEDGYLIVRFDDITPYPSD